MNPSGLQTMCQELRADAGRSPDNTRALPQTGELPHTNDSASAGIDLCGSAAAWIEGRTDRMGRRRKRRNSSWVIPPTQNQSCMVY